MKKLLILMMITLLTVAFIGCSKESSNQKTEEELRAEIKAELEKEKDEVSNKESNNEKDNNTSINNMSQFESETINDYFINYSDYKTVIIPMHESRNQSRLSRSTVSFSDNPKNYKVTFSIFGTMTDIKVDYTSYMGDDNPEIKYIGDLSNTYVEIYAPFSNDGCFVGVEGKIGNTPVSFTLDDMRDLFAYGIILVDHNEEVTVKENNIYDGENDNDINEDDGFEESGTFTGGEVTDGLDIGGIRHGTHDDFERLVFDFYGFSYEGKTGVKRDVPCYYTVELVNPYETTIRLEGARAMTAEIPSFNNSEYIEIIENIPTYDDAEINLRIKYKKPVRLRISDRLNPGRLVIDLKQ